jgi:hypothetical protein
LIGDDTPCKREVISRESGVWIVRASPSRQCGRICIGRRKINLSGVFAGQNVGITEVSENIWLVSFMQYDLGFFDHESGRVECAPNPFGAKVFPCARNGPLINGRGERI